jgi:hypothetical protein
MAKSSDEVVIEYLNNVVRKHKFRFKGERTLPPAKRKTPVLGAAGAAYGATKITV